MVVITKFICLYGSSDCDEQLHPYTQGNQVGIGLGQERYLPHELGEGGRISMPASGNNGAGIVQRYRIIGDCTFAQAPENERYSTGRWDLE